MFTLPNEIIAHICTYANDIEIWSMLAVFNESFRGYTIRNRKPFIAQFTIINTDEISTEYMIFNKFHREDDQPAVVTIGDDSETHEWWCNGDRHRDGDLPALIIFGDAGNSYEWWWYGQRHRDGDRPAVISADSNEWYQYGRTHRDIDAPAVITNDQQEYWRRGKLHRDGNLPAIMHIRGLNKWYVDGQYIGNNTNIEYQCKYNKVSLLTYDYQYNYI